MKFLGLIKDLAISLNHIPSKCMLMDIIVVDIPTKFGMLLSRSWMEKLHCMVLIDCLASLSWFLVVRQGDCT